MHITGGCSKDRDPIHTYDREVIADKYNGRFLYQILQCKITLEVKTNLTKEKEENFLNMLCKLSQ